MASELTWRRLSDKEKKEVEQKAKKIMLDFGDTLESLPDIPEAIVDRAEFERKEGVEEYSSGKGENFRDLMLENAPKKNKDFIIAEKGGWVE